MKTPLLTFVLLFSIQCLFAQNRNGQQGRKNQNEYSQEALQFKQQCAHLLKKLPKPHHPNIVLPPNKKQELSRLRAALEKGARLSKRADKQAILHYGKRIKSALPRTSNTPQYAKAKKDDNTEHNKNVIARCKAAGDSCERRCAAIEDDYDSLDCGWKCLSDYLDCLGDLRAQVWKEIYNVKAKENGVSKRPPVTRG